MEQDNKVRALVIIGGTLLFIFVLSLFLFPVYGRYQKRLELDNEVIMNVIKRNQAILDQENQVKVNEMRIRQTEQLVKVEQQKAQIRVEEAKGISASQQIINTTLTDRYLQHEAIQAQLQMAGSHNNTQIYIPVGMNGIPLVKTLP